MSRNIRAARSALYGIAGLLALSVGGCGGFDGVDLNGKVFDAVGIGTGSKTSSGEPKMAQRSGLVVPPSTESLPAPGSGGQAAPEIAGINDPDKLAVVSQAEKQRQQDEYCKVHYEMAKAHGDDNADLAAGPLGPCKGSVLTALKNWQNGGKDEDE